MTRPDPTPTSPPPILRGIVGGALMGLANLVPGISGGTMLLAAGVYREFVESVAEMSTLRFRLRSIAILGTIVIAATGAIVALAGPVGVLVVERRWAMYSLFIGLTLGGVPILLRMLKPLDRTALVAAAAGIAVMAAMAFLRPADVATSGTGHAYLMLFLAGVAGASAMVLPGVSGGYLLLVLGQYVAILAAVHAFKEGLTARDWAAVRQAMHVVIPVGVGVVVGVVAVSNLVRFLLARCERPTLGVLLGLLLGAVIGLWPFQDGVAPEVGAAFRGDRVAQVDGELVMATTGRVIEPGDYETRFFRPTVLQVLASIGLIGLGFGTSLAVTRFGDGGSTEPSGT